jgi:16S rRNA (uracil1498-N3)-methyltransferase
MRRAPVPGLGAGERLLDATLAHYLGRVLRLRAGDTFVAFDPASGMEADAQVLLAEGATLTVQMGEPRQGRVRAGRAILWVQGLPKGDKADAIVRDATELGATRFVVARSRRSVAKLEGARAAERRARWARIAQEAARQCGRSDGPAIEPVSSWSHALDLATDAQRFCLWEHATEPLGPLLVDALARDAALAFACGPEGGLEEQEVEEARAKGWRAVSHGPFALRTETVAAAVLGAARVCEGLV